MLDLTQKRATLLLGCEQVYVFAGRLLFKRSYSCDKTVVWVDGIEKANLLYLNRVQCMWWAQEMY